MGDYPIHSEDDGGAGQAAEPIQSIDPPVNGVLKSRIPKSRPRRQGQRRESAPDLNALSRARDARGGASAGPQEGDDDPKSKSLGGVPSATGSSWVPRAPPGAVRPRASPARGSATKGAPNGGVVGVDGEAPTVGGRLFSKRENVLPHPPAGGVRGVSGGHKRRAARPKRTRRPLSRSTAKDDLDVEALKENTPFYDGVDNLLSGSRRARSQGTPSPAPPPLPSSLPTEGDAGDALAFYSVAAFAGPVPGYVFQAGPSGVGYYRDPITHIEAQICAAHAVDSMVGDTIAWVVRNAKVKARRCVNFLVDYAMEVSERKQTLHSYEWEGGGSQKRSHCVRENVASALASDRNRPESWGTIVGELARLDAIRDKQSVTYLASGPMAAALAMSSGKAVDDIRAALCAVRSDAKDTAGRHGEVLARFGGMPPRTVWAVTQAVEGAATGEWRAVCAACTRLKGRRLCARCDRASASDSEFGSGSGSGEGPSTVLRTAVVHLNSFGSRLIKDWIWAESVRNGGHAPAGSPMETPTPSELAGLGFGGDGDGASAPLLHFALRLQTHIARRVLKAWRAWHIKHHSQRARQRYENVDVMVGVFSQWRRLAQRTQERAQERAQERSTETKAGAEGGTAVGEGGGAARGDDEARRRDTMEMLQHGAQTA